MKTYQKDGVHYGIKNCKQFRLDNEVVSSEDAIENPAIMDRLIEDGFGYLEVVEVTSTPEAPAAPKVKAPSTKKGGKKNESK